MGRSNGCITVDPIENNQLVTRIQDGALVYVTVGVPPLSDACRLLQIGYPEKLDVRGGGAGCMLAFRCAERWIAVSLTTLYGRVLVYRSTIAGPTSIVSAFKSTDLRSPGRMIA